jgi:dihydrofolate reductase|tara:strand:+ start:2633 stop:3127 length:495 start_codon:yes stop_codon:yes gene_type:complete
MEKNMIRAILAHDSQWGIGKNGDLPWPKNSEDLKWFKECTTGCTVMMGRGTWESLKFKPLPNRTNAIVTSQNIQGAQGCVVADMKSMLKILPQMKAQKNVWIIGGAQLIQSMIPYIDEIWLNDVGGDYECDTFLPQDTITKLFYAKSWEVKSFGTITKWSKNNV